MLGETLKKLRRERGLTLEEVALAVGTSKQTVSRYEKGVISNIPHEKVEALARALSVSPSALMGWESEGMPAVVQEPARPLPVLGEIACGEPIFAEASYEDFATMGRGIDADFCLRAVGDSMIGARIYDGDTVFIRSQDTVENGEIAAVIIHGEATLKRVYYYPEKEKLILSPENPKYEPFVFLGEELDGIRILGKAIAFQSAVR